MIHTITVEKVDTGQVHGWSDRYQEADVVDLPAPPPVE